MTRRQRADADRGSRAGSDAGRPLACARRLVAARVVAVLVATWSATACCADGAAAAGDANRAACAAASEAASGYRAYLPDCRAYELVSPPYREGGVPLDGPAGIAAEGDQLLVGFGGATAGTGNESYDPNRGGDLAVYRLRRSSSGWQDVALNPAAVPFERSVLLAIGQEGEDGNTLWGAQAEGPAHKEDLYLELAGGELREVGPGVVSALDERPILESEELTPVGASRDLRHSLYTVVSATSGDLWPGDATAAGDPSLYEYDYRGIASAEPTLVGVSNQAALDGSPHVNEGADLLSRCGTELGSGELASGGGGSAYNAVSEDGETVFFTADACPGGPAVDELYARVGGSRTVAISEPAKSDCEQCDTVGEPGNARFVGASADGHEVFFTTEQPLLPGHGGMNLYAYDFTAPPASPADPSGRISLLTPTANPEVQGVVRISEDGSHVYFVAKGALAPANAEGEVPQAGADNLYVHEPDPGRPGQSRVAFVATLLTPAEEAEAASEREAIEAQALARAVEFWEARCPPAFTNFSCLEEVEATILLEESTLGYFDIADTLAEDRDVWAQADERPAQATPDGHFLVFDSSAKLTADDPSHVPQLFEYDSLGGPHGEGSLARISIGQDASYDEDGDARSFSEAAQMPWPAFAHTDLPSAARFGLAVSDDGARVFFTSAAPLTPLAVSGQPSVFEYSEGNVYLVSDGRDASTTAGGVPGVQMYGTVPSGRDVFFTTADQLVAQAADTQQALYDAREEGGFPAPTLAPGCLGETCRGASGETPQTSAPASVGQQPSPTVAGSSGAALGAAPRRAPSPPNHAALGNERLARALRACVRLPRRHRRHCRAVARRRYGRR